MICIGMMVAAAYYLGVLILLVLNALAWCLNLLSLPGNWLMLALTATFAWLVHTADGRGISWATIGVLVVLSITGELLESLAGAAGAARLGGSRRGMLLSVLGAVLGSLMGAGVGIPVPIVGSALGAVFGGAVGAFAGAVLGEGWKGRELNQGMEVGRAAFLGRIWGTVGKLAIGAVMFVVAGVDAIL
jgi:uncharacterized protein YqgC (DUF456 family)